MSDPKGEQPHEMSAPFDVHTWEYVDDKYGSPASGGSYEIYKCSVCGKISYSPMAD